MIFRLSVFSFFIFSQLALAFDEPEQDFFSDSSVVESENQFVVNDPFENFNRGVFSGFLFVNTYITGPIANVYSFAMPRILQSGVTNFFNNLYEPIYAINALMILDGSGVNDSIWRFALNSSIGLLGTIDVASKIGINQKETSFSYVLHSYGLPLGPYIVNPLTGPSTALSLTDVAPTILLYSFFEDYRSQRIILQTLQSRANNNRLFNSLKEQEDPYLFVRSFYFTKLESKYKKR